MRSTKTKKDRLPRIFKLLVKGGLFCFGRLVAFALGMATSPIALALMAAFLVGLILAAGVFETANVLSSGQPMTPRP